ncbi:hypothetical protein SDJN03_06864, partial [Cucurbita argyrosperma subsp. sororia]
MDWAAEVAVEMEKTAEFEAEHGGVEDGRWNGEDMRKRNPGFREEGRRELGERENLKHTGLLEASENGRVII